MSVLSILDEIAATSSKLEKEAILRRNMHNQTLKDVVFYAYSPFVRFFIAKESAYSRSQPPSLTLEQALTAIVENISTRRITGTAALQYVARHLSALTEDDATVLQRVILKDLRSGFSESTANKVWKNLVPVFDVMTCHSELQRITFPAYSQLKADGVRCHLEFNESSEALAYARSGNLIDILGVLDGIFYNRNMTLDGELVCYKDGKPLDRKTSNGIINKAIKGTISKEEAELIHFLTWDIVDITSKIPYQKRLGELRELLETEPTEKIMLIPTKIVYDDVEALADFKAMRQLKLEGTIVKNMDHKWVPKRSYDLCKMKDVIDVEMECIGYEEGKKGTKNEGKLGALVFRDADHKIEVSAGTGIEQRDREADRLYNDSVIGTIWTIRYNERITSKDKKRTTESLFLPRIIERRLDKTKPNTYAEILALEKAALEIKND